MFGLEEKKIKDLLVEIQVNRHKVDKYNWTSEELTGGRAKSQRKNAFDFPLLSDFKVTFSGDTDGYKATSFYYVF